MLKQLAYNNACIYLKFFGANKNMSCLGKLIDKLINFSKDVTKGKVKIVSI